MEGVVIGAVAMYPRGVPLELVQRRVSGEVPLDGVSGGGPQEGVQ